MTAAFRGEERQKNSTRRKVVGARVRPETIRIFILTQKDEAAVKLGRGGKLFRWRKKSKISKLHNTSIRKKRLTGCTVASEAALFVHFGIIYYKHKTQ